MFQLLLLVSILISSIDAARGLCKTKSGGSCVYFCDNPTQADKLNAWHTSDGTCYDTHCAFDWWYGYWCATEVDSNYQYTKWDYCNPSDCETSKEVAIADTEDCGDCIGCMFEAGCIAMPSDRVDQCLAKGGTVCGQRSPELHFEKKGRQQAKEEQEEELAAMRRTNKALKAALESLAN